MPKFPTNYISSDFEGDPDEMMTHQTVAVVCKSTKCGGQTRSATKVTYRSGEMVLRCVICKTAAVCKGGKDDHWTDEKDPSKDPQVVESSDDYTVGARYTNLGEEDEQDKGNFGTDHYVRRKGRKHGK